MSGGGVHNKTLIKWLKDEWPEVEIKTIDYGISPDAKEAVAFAILANDWLNGNPTNFKRATGAKQYVLLGNLTPWPRV